MFQKCFALLMAAVMVVSAGSMVLAASPTVPEGTTDSGDFEGTTSATQFKTSEVELSIGGHTYTQSVNATVSTTTLTRNLNNAGKNLLSVLNNVSFRNVLVDGMYYTATLHNDGGTQLKLTLSPAVRVDTTVSFSVRVLGSDPNTGTNLAYKFSGTNPISGGGSSSDPIVDAKIENLSGIRLRDVILCDANGPMPLTENNSNAEDGDRNGSDGVRSGSTLYFQIQEGQYKFDDDLFWKLRVSKSKNGKYVKSVSDVSKTFSKGLFNARDNSAVVTGTSGRHRYIKVVLNSVYTDDEYKIALDLRLTPKQRAIDKFNIDDNAEIKVKDFSFYMKNAEREADNDWKVGINGLMLNPLENDWNEVTYYDENGDLAFMKFFADSDVSKFYAKLSTKWEHADYASYFNDQDAYIFDFSGSPKISATSRCDLQIYNPFVDEDGNETIDPTTAVIYQVIDGDLYDVTSSFTYEEGDNGEMAYTTRTRFLGTYVICEKPIEEAQ